MVLSKAHAVVLGKGKYLRDDEPGATLESPISTFAFICALYTTIYQKSR